MHCSLVNNNYQQATKVFFAFVPDKQFVELVTIALHSIKMLKTINAEFHSTDVWLTDKKGHFKYKICEYNSNNWNSVILMR